MPETPWDRRGLLQAISVGAATGFLAGGARDAAAQQVKWSEGTEPPKLKAPPYACDCHHHIYDARYPVDPKAVRRPGDALVEDYRAFQKRIGTSRDVVVTPSTYGVDNRVTLDAVATLGPSNLIGASVLERGSFGRTPAMPSRPLQDVIGGQTRLWPMCCRPSGSATSGHGG